MSGVLHRLDLVLTSHPNVSVIEHLLHLEWGTYRLKNLLFPEYLRIVPNAIRVPESKIGKKQGFRSRRNKGKSRIDSENHVQESQQRGINTYTLTL